MQNNTTPHGGREALQTAPTKFLKVASFSYLLIYTFFFNCEGLVGFVDNCEERRVQW